jgi:hypothetical protein
VAETSTPGYMRDLTGQVDRFGHISVAVEIGGGPGARLKELTGASALPATVARFLRELADDVERLCKEAV